MRRLLAVAFLAVAVAACSAEARYERQDVHGVDCLVNTKSGVVADCDGGDWGPRP